MSDPTNVLFIVIDQLRADCVSGALAEHVAMPNIRALAADAVSFSHHFSVTNPCGPSRASILTGLYAMNHRSVRNGTPLSDGLTNLALEMRAHGYEPELFGYTDTSRDPRGKSPDDPVLHNYEEVLPGFAEIVEMRQDSGNAAWQKYLKDKGYDLPDYNDFYVPVPPVAGQAPYPDDPAFYRAEDSDTAFLTDAFLAHNRANPAPGWFALLTYIRPHPPLVAPEPYNKMYTPADMPLPERMTTTKAEEAVHPMLAAKRQRPPMEAAVDGCWGQISAERDADVRLIRALYFGLITEVDVHVGRVIEHLKQTGQYENTKIILTADHGEMLGDHHMWGKSHVYDPAYRVPLIIRDPACRDANGTTVSHLTESVDITPTILDLAGRAIPGSMDGRSLRPFLSANAPENWRDAVHLELDLGEPIQATAVQRKCKLDLHDANLAILREADFKLVHFNGGLPPLLFDLKNDPTEMHNLANDPAHMPTLLRLTQKLLSHRMRHMDRTLSDLTITSDGVVGVVPSLRFQSAGKVT